MCEIKNRPAAYLSVCEERFFLFGAEFTRQNDFTTRPNRLRQANRADYNATPSTYRKHRQS